MIEWLTIKPVSLIRLNCVEIHETIDLCANYLYLTGILETIKLCSSKFIFSLRCFHTSFNRRLFFHWSLRDSKSSQAIWFNWVLQGCGLDGLESSYNPWFAQSFFQAFEKWFIIIICFLCYFLITYKPSCVT